MSLRSQATNQTDLENWVTAIHSASASLLAKRQGKEDTVRLLRSQVRSLLQKIDMDGKMKKMAELQLTVVGDPKNRKAIENQVRPCFFSQSGGLMLRRVLALLGLNNHIMWPT